MADTEIIDVFTRDELDKMRTQAQEEQTAAEKQTESLFDDLNQKFAQKTGTLTLYFEGTINDLEFLEKFPSDRFAEESTLLEYIRGKYGAGSYRVHGRVNGKRGIVVNKLLRIGKTLEQLKEEKAAKSTGMVPYDAKAAGDSQLYYMIAEANRRQEELLKTLMAPKKTNWDFLKQPEILAIVAPLAAKVVERMFAPKDNMGELKQMLEVAELLKSNTSDNEKDDGMLDTLGKVIGAAAGAFGQRAQPRPVPQPNVGDEYARAAEEGQQDWIETQEAETLTADGLARWLQEEHDLNGGFAKETAEHVKRAVGNDYQLMMQAMFRLDDAAYESAKAMAIASYGLPANMSDMLDGKRRDYQNEIDNLHS